VATAHDPEHNRIFRQAAQVGEELARLLRTLAASTFKAEVAIVTTGTPGGPPSFFLVHDQPAIPDQYQLYSAFHQLNVAIDFAAPESDLSQYRLVVAPTPIFSQAGVKENLEQFVSRMLPPQRILQWYVDQQDRIF